MDFNRLDALAGQVRSARPLNQTELRRLRSEFMIEYTYDSNAIEGNSLTLRETALILQEGITIGEKPLKEHLEAIGHRDAFEYVVSVADRDMALSEEIIKAGLLPVNIKYADRRRYYAAFDQYYGGRHSLDAMAELIAEYETEELERRLAILGGCR